MSNIRMDFYSVSLQRTVPVWIILPNDLLPAMTEGNEHYARPMKALYLLHGYSGNYMDWALGSPIQELAVKYHLAAIMPSGENSFYLNSKGTGRAYADFIGKELPEYISRTFGLPGRKEDTLIGGYSMGGFGAIHTALAFPERFAKVFALSSALIVNEIKSLKPGTDNGVADYDYYAGTFGDLQHLGESENNPEFLIRKLKQQGIPVPPMFLACGTEDFLLENNREFRDFLSAEGIDFVYKESAGMHDWQFWNSYLEEAIQWLLGSSPVF